MTIIATTQLFSISLSIIRQKCLALLLGPSGIGLLSIFNNLQSMASQAAGLGMGNSGVREIAAARENYETLGRVRRVLFAAHFVQGLVALVSIWLLREKIAQWLFDDPHFATEVGLVGIAVLVTLLTTAQTALLRGVRRISDLGRVTVLGAMGGTIVGLAAVWAFGETGLIWFVLAQPVCNLLAARWFTRRLPRAEGKPPRLREIPAIWLPMVKLGAAFMVGGLATAITLLLVRGHISGTLGLEAAGLFAAAWGISMTYVGFLLSAMGADYFPRLTEVINDQHKATELINDQTQLGLAIGGPILLILIGWSPWIISALYSKEFSSASDILQWQSAGNIFKLASWPLSYALLARSRAKLYLLTQFIFNVIFISVMFTCLGKFGIFVSGPAFLFSYLIYFFSLIVISFKIFEFRLLKINILLLLVHTMLSFGLICAAYFSPTVAFLSAPALAIATGIFGLRITLAKIGPHGRIPKRLTKLFDKIGWPIRKFS
ncbi:O-antigen translocase [Martelella sp. FOR1707]